MVQHNSIDHTGITGVGGSVATDTIWNAAGDLAVGTGSDTAARLAIGANATVLTSNGTTATWAAPAAAGAPSCSVVFVTTDVVIPSANTVQDITSLSLAAGSWLLFGACAITSGNAGQTQLTVALFDGTSIIADAQVVQQAGIGNVTQTAFVAGRITLGGTTTVKLQAFSVRGTNDSKVDDTNSSNGTADKGSYLIALAVTAV